MSGGKKREKRKIIQRENINETRPFAYRVRGGMLNLWSDFSTVGRRSLNEWPLKGNIFPRPGFPDRVKEVFAGDRGVAEFAEEGLVFPTSGIKRALAKKLV